MKFQSLQILDLVAEVQKKIVFSFVFTVVIYTGGTFLLYKKGGIDMPFIVSDVLMLIIFSSFQYFQITGKSSIANNTATEVKIDENTISVATAPFKAWFLINKPSKQFDFEIEKLTIALLPYRLKDVYDIKDYVIGVGNRKQMAFVIADFFNEALRKKLEELNGREIQSF